jgi:hypothetical protein
MRTFFAIKNVPMDFIAIVDVCVYAFDDASAPKTVMGLARLTMHGRTATCSA